MMESLWPCSWCLAHSRKSQNVGYCDWLRPQMEEREETSLRAVWTQKLTGPSMVSISSGIDQYLTFKLLELRSLRWQVVMEFQTQVKIVLRWVMVTSFSETRKKILEAMTEVEHLPSHRIFNNHDRFSFFKFLKFCDSRALSYNPIFQPKEFPFNPSF